MGYDFDCLGKEAQRYVLKKLGEPIPRDLQERKNKYGNKKTMLDGHLFDSKHEAERYAELKMLERAGEITDLRLQVPFELCEAHKRRDGTMERGVKYIADFVYQRRGKCVVEDAKGDRTDVYILKRKWMYQKYGIEIKEV